MPPYFAAGVPVLKAGVPLFGGCSCCCGFSLCNTCVGYTGFQYEVDIGILGTYTIAHFVGCQYRYTAATTTCREIQEVLFRNSISTSCLPGIPASNWEVRVTVDFGPAATRDLNLVAPVCISNCDVLEALDQSLTFYNCITGTGGACDANSLAPITGRITRI